MSQCYAATPSIVYTHDVFMLLCCVMQEASAIGPLPQSPLQPLPEERPIESNSGDHASPVAQ